MKKWKVIFRLNFVKLEWFVSAPNMDRAREIFMSQRGSRAKIEQIMETR